MEQDYDKLIEQRSQHVFDVMSRRVSADELKLMQKAFEFARKAHSWQTRKTGEPYILHPIAWPRLLQKNWRSAHIWL